MKRIRVVCLSVFFGLQCIAWAGADDDKAPIMFDRQGVAQDIEKYNEIIHQEFDLMRRYIYDQLARDKISRCYGYDRRQAVPENDEELALFTRLLNNCYVWFLFDKKYSRAYEFRLNMKRMTTAWEQGRSLNSKVYTDNDGVKHEIFWADEGIMDTPQCKSTFVPKNNSRRQQRKKRYDIIEHTCLYPEGFEENRIEYKYAPNRVSMTVFWDDKQINERDVLEIAVVTDSETGFNSLHYWIETFNYTEYYEWLNKRQQDIKNGLPPIAIDPKMFCEDTKECFAKISEQLPDIKDIEKYESLKDFPHASFFQISGGYGLSDAAE